MKNYPVLTAREFIEQGTRAYQIVSMAKSSPARRQLMDAARTVASLTGDSMQVPGSIGYGAANDNRRRGKRALAAVRRAA